jgi:hypothetical protein
LQTALDGSADAQSCDSQWEFGQIELSFSWVSWAFHQEPNHDWSILGTLWRPGWDTPILWPHLQDCEKALTGLCWMTWTFWSCTSLNLLSEMICKPFCFECWVQEKISSLYKAFLHFSRVKARIARSVVKLYPREGDVWTLYKTWNKKSVSVNAEAKKFEYELVEVQSRFSLKLEGLKVLNFRTVFNTGHHG